MLDSFTLAISQLLPEPHASLLSGMLFGIRTSIPEDFYQDLITTGVLHVVALSGMNISIISRLLFEILGNLLGRLLGVFITIIGIVSFVLLVGPSETIVRASIMGVITILSALFGRKDVPLISLFFTVLIMILINNEVISSISFQLSVCATLGILLFGGSTRENQNTVNSEDAFNNSFKNRDTIVIGFFRNLIANDLKITLSAQVFTAPLILYYFHRISLISPVTNIATGWLVPPIMYLGFIMIIASYIWWPLGRIMSFIVWALLSLFIYCVELFSQVPLASIEIAK